MKLDLPSIRSLISKRKIVGDSDSALVEVMKSKKKSHRKRVRFAEERNQEYLQKPRTQYAMSDLWYSQKDIARFEYRTIQRVGQWTDENTAHQRIYQAFYSMESEEELEEYLKCIRLRLKEEDIGLEMITLYGLPSQIMGNTQTRRRTLRHIKYFQNATFLAADIRAEDIAVAVGQESRSSCIYAAYIAEKAAKI